MPAGRETPHGRAPGGHLVPADDSEDECEHAADDPEDVTEEAACEDDSDDAEGQRRDGEPVAGLPRGDDDVLRMGAILRSGAVLRGA